MAHIQFSHKNNTHTCTCESVLYKATRLSFWKSHPFLSKHCLYNYGLSQSPPLLTFFHTWKRKFVLILECVSSNFSFHKKCTKNRLHTPPPQTLRECYELFMGGHVLTRIIYACTLNITMTNFGLGNIWWMMLKIKFRIWNLIWLSCDWCVY